MKIQPTHPEIRLVRVIRRSPLCLPEPRALDAKFQLGIFVRMSTVSIRKTKSSPRKPRARAKGRTVHKGPSFGEWARRVAGMVKSGEGDLSTRSYEPNETTAAAIREPIDTLTKYRTVDEALGQLKSHAKRRPKKPVSA
jgi:hypothetical protein